MGNKKTIEQSISESFDRIFGDSANLALKPGSCGIKYSINKNPSVEELSKFNGIDKRAESIIDFIKRATESRERAKILLTEAYEKGEFDVIIQHLEEAKKIALHGRKY